MGDFIDKHDLFNKLKEAIDIPRSCTNVTLSISQTEEPIATATFRPEAKRPASLIECEEQIATLKQNLIIMESNYSDLIKKFNTSKRLLGELVEKYEKITRFYLVKDKKIIKTVKDYIL